MESTLEALWERNVVRTGDSFLVSDTELHFVPSAKLAAADLKRLSPFYHGLQSFPGPHCER